jgi:hypothetical protein
LFSIYLLGKGGFWIFNTIFGIIMLRHVHGCGRMLWWAPCIKIMYLRQYRKFKKTQRDHKMEQNTYQSVTQPSEYEPCPVVAAASGPTKRAPVFRPTMPPPMVPLQ